MFYVIISVAGWVIVSAMLGWPLEIIIGGTLLTWIISVGVFYPG